MSDPAQPISSSHEVARGGSVIDARLVDALVRGRRPRGRLDLPTLRERDVPAPMAAGLDNTAIAGALFLTVRAVDEHIDGILGKALPG